MAPRVAIIIYSLYGHVTQLAEAELEGIKKAGGDAKIFQVAETLSEDILVKMKALPKPDYPVITPGDLINYDAFLWGIPARYGSVSSQWKNFLDSTGQLWMQGALYGKYVGIFVSTGGLGGGQESTHFSVLSTLVHHGMMYVPFGYAKAVSLLANLEEVHGGSPWGAGTLAGAEGSRQPSELEKNIARAQGAAFWEAVSKVSF
ncbi:NADH-quinone oxidoreductase [Flagelloscypha sp. PMI_526]|nr:NADH-quinone oxidoreductase [Flagelloscypha sp. PMI_526]